MAAPVPSNRDKNEGLYLKRLNGQSVNLSGLADQSKNINQPINIRCRSTEPVNPKVKPSRQLGNISIYDEAAGFQNTQGVLFGSYSPLDNSINIFVCDIDAQKKLIPKQPNKNFSIPFTLAHETGHYKDKVNGNVDIDTIEIEKQEAKLAEQGEKLLGAFKSKHNIDLGHPAFRNQYPLAKEDEELVSMSKSYGDAQKLYVDTKIGAINDYVDNKYSSSPEFEQAYAADLKYQLKKGLKEVAGMSYFVEYKKEQKSQSNQVEKTKQVQDETKELKTKSQKRMMGELHSELYAYLNVGRTRFDKKDIIKEYFPNTYKLMQKKYKTK